MKTLFLTTILCIIMSTLYAQGREIHKTTYVGPEVDVTIYRDINTNWNAYVISIGKDLGHYYKIVKFGNSQWQCKDTFGKYVNGKEVEDKTIYTITKNGGKWTVYKDNVLIQSFVTNALSEEERYIRDNPMYVPPLGPKQNAKGEWNY